MAQRPDAVVYKNVLAWRGCDKLHLDARTADVFFTFALDGESNEKIPAHKAILSAISPAFDAMFYGPLKHEGDILIEDATPDAFREFLQFFYRSTVKVTTQNVDEVLNLGKQYLVDDCLNACTEFYETTLAMDNMCWGYELALLFDQQRLQKFCEKNIAENTEEVFQSSSFLNCEPNLLRHILQLDALTCNETVVFMSCIQWAKNACVRKGLDENDPKNVRSELGELFYEIRFGEMTIEDFHTCYRFDKGIFTHQEFEDIIGMIASKEFQADKFNRNPRKATKKHTNVLVCNRINWRVSFDQRACSLLNLDCTVFSSSTLLLLKKFHCSEVFHPKTHDETEFTYFPTKMKVIEMTSNGETEDKSENVIHFRQFVLSPKCETVIELPTPIIIKPDVKYGIVFSLAQYNSQRFHPGRIQTLPAKRLQCFNYYTYKPEEVLSDGTVIKFHRCQHINTYCTASNDRGLVTRLDFLKYKE